MKARRKTTADVAKVTKAIAAARGTDDLMPAVVAGAPEEEGSAIGLDDIARESIRLSFLIHDVSRMRRNAYDQFMKPLGITRAQWWVLAHLSRHDGMMQTQLADVLEVGKASLGDVVESLESAGWIERHPDPTDKRAKRVYLTKPSQGLIKRMTTAEVEFNEKVFSDLALEERAALSATLLKVKGMLSRMNSGSS